MRVVPCGQTEEQTGMTKLVDVFRNFAKAHKNTMFRIYIYVCVCVCVCMYIKYIHTYIHTRASEQNIQSLILHFIGI